MSYRLCESQLMEQLVEQPCYCDFRLCGKKKIMRCIDILIMKKKPTKSILVMYKTHQLLIKVYITALKRFRILSNVLHSQPVGIPIINE